MRAPANLDRRSVTKAVAAALLCCVASPAQAERYSPAALQVLAKARAASGGGGWNLLRGWHEAGQDGGLRYEAWLDPVRYGMRVEIHEPAGLHVHGFNGGGDWQIYPDGRVTGVDDRPTVAAARTEAFFRVHAYFYTGRFDAKADALGVRRGAGGAFDVLRIQPVGGEPRELWFDRRTHLLARMVDRSGPRPVSFTYSEYRKVGPVRVPFRVRTEDGDPAHARERVVESLSFTPADRTLFSLPRTRAAQ